MMRRTYLRGEDTMIVSCDKCGIGYRDHPCKDDWYYDTCPECVDDDDDE